MADVGKGVRAVLTADAGVSADAGTRVYPDALPQNATLPAIRYAVIDDRSEQHLTGIAGLANATIQIDCYALTRLAANDLGDDVRLALDRYEGTSSGVTIRQVVGDFRRYGYEPPRGGGDVGTYVYSADFSVWYVEATS